MTAITKDNATILLINVHDLRWFVETSDNRDISERQMVLVNVSATGQAAKSTSEPEIFRRWRNPFTDRELLQSTSNKL